MCLVSLEVLLLSCFKRKCPNSQHHPSLWAMTHNNGETRQLNLRGSGHPSLEGTRVQSKSHGFLSKKCRFQDHPSSKTDPRIFWCLASIRANVPPNEPPGPCGMTAVQTRPNRAQNEQADRHGQHGLHPSLWASTGVSGTLRCHARHQSCKSVKERHVARHRLERLPQVRFLPVNLKVKAKKELCSHNLTAAYGLWFHCTYWAVAAMASALLCLYMTNFW